MAATCRLFAFCVLAFSAVSTMAGTPSVRQSSGLIIASAQVSRPIGLTEISAQRDKVSSASMIPQVTPAGWYLHAIRPETILFELSTRTRHLILESSRLVSLDRELSAIAMDSPTAERGADILISITTIAD